MSFNTLMTPGPRLASSKQAMAELVGHLETHGYVVRVPDPSDRRAKLVRPTERGHQVFKIAQELVPEIEARTQSVIGADRKAPFVATPKPSAVTSAGSPKQPAQPS
jgi:DNA-binding MarR family transcriptional regulator